MANTGRGRPRERRREVYVFTEGEVTEPEYVDQLKRRQHGFAVKVSNEHGGPDKIVPLAIRFKQDKDRDAEREGLPPVNGRSSGACSTVTSTLTWTP